MYLQKNITSKGAIAVKAHVGTAHGIMPKISSIPRKVLKTSIKKIRKTIFDSKTVYLNYNNPKLYYGIREGNFSEEFQI